MDHHGVKFVLFVLDTTFAEAVVGWSLFVAAMTPNSDLRADLIKSVHDRASLYGNQSIGAFPVTYRSIDGITTSEIGRSATYEYP